MEKLETSVAKIGDTEWKFLISIPFGSKKLTTELLFFSVEKELFREFERHGNLKKQS